MIVYSTRTGNSKYIVDKLELPNVELENGLLINSPFFILTYTDKLGEIPEKVYKFMLDNHTNCYGIIGTGNSNFGINNFCGAVNKLNEKFNIPIIAKLELRGYNKDYEKIIYKYKKIIEGG